MGKNKIILITLLAVLIAGTYLLVRPYLPQYKWATLLRHDKKEPYDLDIFVKTLEESAGENKFVYERDIMPFITDKNRHNDNCIFIGNSLIINENLADSLLDFVSRGNRAMIMLNGEYELYNFFSDDSVTTVADTIALPDSTRRELVTSTRVNKASVKLEGASDTCEFIYRLLKEDQPAYWNHFQEDYQEFFDYSTEKLGEIDSCGANYISVSIGKGKLLLHTNPIMFSNYFIKSESGFNYAAGCLSHLNGGDIILYKPSGFYLLGQINFQSPLSYIMSVPSLRYAWNIFLVILIIFFVFGSKRKQRIIPVILPRKNSSIASAEMIATFYYHYRDHKYIAKEMASQFRNFILERYRIKRTTEVKDIIPGLAGSSGISEDHIEQIFKAENMIIYGDTKNADILISYYNLIEYFYKNCK